jgi:hypothetical protein
MIDAELGGATRDNFAYPGKSEKWSKQKEERGACPMYIGWIKDSARESRGASELTVAEDFLMEKYVPAYFSGGVEVSLYSQIKLDHVEDVSSNFLPVLDFFIHPFYLRVLFTCLDSDTGSLKTRESR